jgi:hypothetical protein
MAEAVSPEQQAEWDRAYQQYLKSEAKRAWPDSSYRDQFNRVWRKPSDIFERPELADPDPRPTIRRRNRIQQTDIKR